MLPLRVAFYLLLAIAGGGGEVKVDKQQRVLESRSKEQEREGRGRKEQEEGGLQRSSRDLEQFERPTTLQRMLEEASSHFGRSVSMVLIRCGESSKAI